MIAMMKDKYGLSHGDICGLLEDGFGIEVSRGGAAQVVLRVAERARPVYEGLKQIVRRSDTVYPDETGWKVGGLLRMPTNRTTSLMRLSTSTNGSGRESDPASVVGGRISHLIRSRTPTT